MNKDLIAIIKLSIKEQNINQTKIARDLNIHRNAITNMFRIKKIPLKHAMYFAELTNNKVTVEDILNQTKGKK